ncbi:hypothetical protein [Paraburkholderia xenovorans]|uniref:hypothetical protein n=1 Tax=Paraburkholderia xenovorans TaxID=36873 RepID=UPI0038B81064
MTVANTSMNGSHGPVPESLQTLVEYLELSLDKASSVVMTRHTTDVCTVYLGDPAGLIEEMKKVGTIAIPLANEMLELTRSGVNEMEIGGQAYRFVRTFTQVEDAAAVVFSAA